MTRRAAPPVVALLASADAFRGLDSRLRAAGIRVVRLNVLRVAPRPPARWQPGMPAPARIDTLIVTARPAVTQAAVLWSRASVGRPASVECWASGPGTAAGLRARGVRPVRRGAEVGGESIVRGLGPRPRRIVYLRSNLAGPGLARLLRARGHSVTERVVYTVQVDPRPVRAHRRILLRAGLVIAASPSALAALQRGLTPTQLALARRQLRTVVLGARTAKAARSAGLRRVRVAPSVAPQRFARFLVQELRHAHG